MDLPSFLRQSVNILADILIVLIFIRVILSWLAPSRNRLTEFIHDITEPLLRPLRELLPRTGAIDISPILAYFLIELARRLLNSFL